MIYLVKYIIVNNLTVIGVSGGTRNITKCLQKLVV
jgi:hypothetical protein